MMTALWMIAVGVLLVVGAAPALYLVSRGTDAARLVGLQFGSVAAVMILMGLSVAVGQTSYLIVPLVLAVLSTTGTLVFTRLIRPRADEAAAHDGE